MTAVQRAPVGEPRPPQPSATGATASAEDTSLPTGSLMLTVAVNDVDATKIVYAPSRNSPASG